MDYNQINNPKPFGLWRILFVVALFLIATPFVAPYLRDKISLVKEKGQELTTDTDGFNRVSKIIDGDTIELLGGIRIRYIGINAPEIANDPSLEECYGNEAKIKNAELLKDKKVKLVADKENEDQYGRLLRYVYLEDGTFVNLELVKNGFARTLPIAPNTEFKNEFVSAENSAKKNGLGLWKSCE